MKRLRPKLLVFVFACLQAALAQAETVTLQLIWKHQFQFAGYYIAKEKGYYADEGIDVHIQEYMHDTALIPDMLEGKTDFAVGRSSILVNKGKGAPITALMAAFQHSPLMLITRGDITSPEQIRGKKVMLTNDARDVAEVQAMLLRSGILPEDYIKQAHSFNIDDLISGKTDAMGAYISNEPFQMINRDEPYAVLHPADYGFDMYSDILFTHNETLRTRPELVERFVRASIKEWVYAFDNIDETAQLIAQKYNTQQRTLGALIYEGQALKKLAFEQHVPFGQLTEERFRAMANIYLIAGLLDKDDSIANFVYQRNKTLIERSPYLLWLMIVLLLSIGLVVYLSYRNHLADQRNEELKEHAEHDPLTGLFNRRKMITRLTEAINLCQRYQRPLTCIFLDLDDFKHVNDTYGHATGDEVLKVIATQLQNNLRRTDIFARWGGEEFIVALPETDLETAQQVAEGLRKHIRRAKMPYHGRITASLGVTEYRSEETLEEFIGRADEALYQAKTHGKNRFCVL